MRQFVPSWFKGQFSKWLEYSVKKDVAYCLCCYLFKKEFIHESAGEFYTKNDFRAWNKGLERFCLHVGDVNSVHDKYFKKMLDLSNHHKSIQVVFYEHSNKLKSEYQMRLEASIDVDSYNGMGTGIRDVGKVILENVPQNDILTCPMIQKDIINVYFAKKHFDVEDFFCHVTNVLNVIGGSFKRRDLLRHLQAEKFEQLLESGEVHIGRGLNQERGLQRPELNDRFDVVSSDLLLGMVSLNPANYFANFDKGRIMTLAKYYPNEFDEVHIRDLSYQLDTFIVHMLAGNPKFSKLQGISYLSKALVEANLVQTYSYVYLLVKLTLILPVITATVERAFSSMKQIKNEEWNNTGDQYLNDCLVCYIGRDVFTNVSNDVIIDRFQNLKIH
ncbi:uncharacterized protein [Nicotiana tomentosiformis]|uniref:uncharacterized protein n=1 Tax=Nicotiana tomentosiformis TaxID=4098 RepID=UPI00388C90B2